MTMSDTPPGDAAESGPPFEHLRSWANSPTSGLDSGPPKVGDVHGPIPSPKGTLKGIDARTGISLAVFAAGMVGLFFYDPLKKMNFTGHYPKEPKLSKGDEQKAKILSSLMGVKEALTSSFKIPNEKTFVSQNRNHEVEEGRVDFGEADPFGDVDEDGNETGEYEDEEDE